ncbi:DUF688 family protein [Quillaja saponaria]|uniref:DUF688 family protein n=1 Tax=Quillaja saponaria TaxID=32244 RepID=A0AAD7KWW9_QUISA|nr:DUF688 family protein [Quillaja saponaria]KAJ7947094.1 DUF688 family protein [Quillaja saponaria]
MAERKLNINAPLLSVRRVSAKSTSSNGENSKILQKSIPNRQHSLPSYSSDLTLDQVTEPVAVPFNWEKIPGRCKGGSRRETQDPGEASATPRLPPGKSFSAEKQSLGKQHIIANRFRYTNKAYSFNDNVVTLDCDKEGKYEKRGSVFEDEEDAYSDALHILSPTESFSWNCNVSHISGYGSDVKQGGTFSTDPQTQEFMMSRFLPAAKAMALQPPQYARKHSGALEQPREITKLVGEEKMHLVDKNQSAVIPYYGQSKEEEEESENEDGEYDDSTNISAKGCGLFPQLSLKNSLCRLSPVPGLKMKNRLAMSPTRDVGKQSKESCNQSHIQTVKKLAWDTFSRKKSGSGAGSPDLQDVKNKRNSDSKRFTYSGELQTQGRLSPFRRSRGSSTSPCRSRATQSPLRALRFLGSSKEADDNKADSLNFCSQVSGNLKEVQSPEAKNGSHSVSIGESKRFNYSGNLQTPGRSSPFRCSRSTGVSPCRSRGPQSPFGTGGRLLAGSGEDENNIDDRIKFFRRVSRNLQQVHSQEAKRSSNSTNHAIEKTVYVDTINTVGISSSKSSYVGIKGKMEFEGEEYEALKEKKGKEETSTTEFLCQDIKPLDSLKGTGILESGVSGSIYSNLSTFSETLNLRVQRDNIEECKLDHRINEEKFSSEHIKEIADRKLNVNRDQTLIADDSENVVTGSAQSHLPPPLPKSPSESWLWRTLPLVSLRNSFLSSGNGNRSHTKKQDTNMTSTNTRWETIVKTSKLRHDHVRYSEELTANLSQQSKT